MWNTDEFNTKHGARAGIQAKTPDEICMIY